MNDTIDFRLGDKVSRTHFILGKKDKLCSNSIAYALLGEPDLLYTSRAPHAQFVVRYYRRGRARSLIREFYGKPMGARMASYVQVYLIYYKHAYAFFDMLREDVAHLKCTTNRAEIQSVFANSMVSKVLAAQILGFPKCYSVNAGLSSAPVTECALFDAKFEALRDLAKP